MFIGQLYEDESLMLNAHDSFDLLYNWPPNIELLLNNSLLERIYIYFLILTHLAYVANAVRRCNIVLALERRYKYM